MAFGCIDLDFGLAGFNYAVDEGLLARVVLAVRLRVFGVEQHGLLGRFGLGLAVSLELDLVAGNGLLGPEDKVVKAGSVLPFSMI